MEKASWCGNRPAGSAPGPVSGREPVAGRFPAKARRRFRFHKARAGHWDDTRCCCPTTLFFSSPPSTHFQKCALHWQIFGIAPRARQFLRLGNATIRVMFKLAPPEFLLFAFRSTNVAALTFGSLGQRDLGGRAHCPSLGRLAAKTTQSNDFPVCVARGQAVETAVVRRYIRMCFCAPRFCRVTCDAQFWDTLAPYFLRHVSLGRCVSSVLLCPFALSLCTEHLFDLRTPEGPCRQADCSNSLP